jgi:hypothetical protein
MKKGVLLCSIFLSIFFLAPQSQLSSSPQRQQNREKVIQKKKEQTSATTETQASQRILTRKDLILRSRAQEDTVYWARLFKAYKSGTLTRIIPLQNGGCLAAIFNADPGPSWLTLSPKGLIEKQEIKFPCVDIHPTLDGGYIGVEAYRQMVTICGLPSILRLDRRNGRNYMGDRNSIMAILFSRLLMGAILL